MPDAVLHQRLQKHAGHQKVRGLRIDLFHKTQLVPEADHFDCHVIINEQQFFAQGREIIGFAEQASQDTGELVNHVTGLLGIAADQR